MNAASMDFDDEPQVEMPLAIAPPAVTEEEELLLSLCFLDPADTMLRCDQAHITASSFHFEKPARVFAAIQRAWKATGNVDIAAVATELRDSGALEKIGGWNYLMQVSRAVPTQVSTISIIQAVRKAELSRDLVKLGQEITERARSNEDPKELLTMLEKHVNRLSTPTVVKAPLVSLGDFVLPPDGDPSILLGNRYLNRGDGAVLVGTSGIGKSSMSIQMAVCWALGLRGVGIPCNGPLRSLIIQSEDSDGDVAEIWTSMSYVMKLTEEEKALVKERVKVVSERVLRGDRFIASLAKLVEQHKPDIVIINPLQAFMDGDVTDSQDLGKFLREGLNGINNGRFAYLLVHHTTKPSTGKDRTERLWHEVMYDMAGGAEIINWARAILSIRPASDEGTFNLVLAKRGRRAGAVRMVEHGMGTREEPVTTIPLKHAEGKIDGIPGRSKPLPVIYWEDRAPDPKAIVSENKGGRPPKHSFDDYRNVMPAKSEAPMTLAPLHRRLQQNKKISYDSLHTALKRWEEDGFVQIIRQPGQPDAYRMAK